MTDTRTYGLVDVLLVVGVLAAAAGIRVWYLNSCADHGHSAGPLLVQGERDSGWGSATLPRLENNAHRAPLYPWLVSLLSARAPDDVPWVQQMMRWIQCGLGALTAALYCLFARRAFGSRLVSVLAGLLCAVYPFWVINTAEIQDGVVASFFLALALALAAHANQAGGVFSSLLYGLALAGLALVRGALLPFAVVALLWVLFRCRWMRRGWLYAVLAFVGFAAGLAPWTVRNFQELHDVYPVVDTAYLHLWLGNNPNATGGPGSESGAPPTNKDRAEAVLQEVRDNPAGTLQRRLWAGLDFFFGEEWFKEGRLWQPNPVATAGQDAPEWVRRSHAAVLYGSLLGLLIPAVLGWRWSFGSRHAAMPSSLAVLWIPLPYLLSHAGALHGPRLPLDGVFLCYGALAVACVVPAVRRAAWGGGPSAAKTKGG